MKESARTAPTNLRARMGMLLLGAVALLGLLVGATVAPLAHANEREDEASKKLAAEQKIQDLQGELEGLDADLAEVFLDLERVGVQLTDAQDELAVAQERLFLAEQELSVVTEQLEVAEATAAMLAEDLDESAQQEEELNSAVGSMARDLYRGGSQSALTLVMTSDASADINERAASAVTMSRAQTRALEEVRSSMATIRNQSERQQATTVRIGELQEEAEQKRSEAQLLQNEVQAQVDNLAEIQGELIEKQSVWDGKKQEAERQLTQWQDSRDAAAQRIAEIDAENQRQQLKFAEEAAQREAQLAAEQAASAPTVPSTSSPDTGGMFGYPLPAGSAYVTSNYGWRIHPIFGTSKLHDGTDFGAACGSPQYAIRSGVVASAYFDSGGGNMVTINHGLIDGSSWASEHLHLQSMAVSAGQQVARGDLIGWTGSTGNSTGCHLHLSMYRNGSTVNPMDYL